MLGAWTGFSWLRLGLARRQVLGGTEDDGDPPATILATARPEQRR